MHNRSTSWSRALRRTSAYCLALVFTGSIAFGERAARAEVVCVDVPTAPAAEVAAPTPGQTTTIAEAIWDALPGDDPERLRTFLEAFNRFRSGPFTGNLGTAHFEATVGPLASTMPAVWGRGVTITEARKGDVFDTVLNALSTVTGAAETHRDDALIILERWFVRENPLPSPFPDRLLTYMLYQELQLPTGPNLFCGRYLDPSTTRASPALLQAALQIVPHRLAQQYLVTGQSIRLFHCLYNWSMANGVEGARLLLPIIAHGLSAGDFEWVPLVERFIVSMSDTEPLGMLQETGVITGLAYSAMTRNEFSLRAATLLARDPIFGPANWHAVFSGLLNNSVESASVGHLDLLVELILLNPAIAPNVKTAALASTGTPAQPPGYYQALNLLIAQID